MHKNYKQAGFTLIELLIVIAVMAILATVVFVAIDPVARFEDARNSRRWTDINSIMGGIKLYQVDKVRTPGDALILAISTMSTSSYYQIGSSEGTDCRIASCSFIDDEGNTSSIDSDMFLTTCFNLEGLVDSGHLGKIPTDPSGGTVALTGYYIRKFSNGQLRIGTCGKRAGFGRIE